jgi:hypothetical protein
MKTNFILVGVFFSIIPLCVNALTFETTGEIRIIKDTSEMLEELKDSLNKIYTECIKTLPPSPATEELRLRHEIWIKEHEAENKNSNKDTSNGDAYSDVDKEFKLYDQIDAYIEECSFFLKLNNKKLLNYFLDRVCKTPSKFTSTFLLLLLYTEIFDKYGDICNFAWEFMKYSSALEIDRDMFLVACVECMGAYAATYSLYVIYKYKKEFAIDILSLEEPEKHLSIYDYRLFEKVEARNSLHGNLGFMKEKGKNLICWNSREYSFSSNKNCVWKFDKKTKTGKVFFENWIPTRSVEEIYKELEDDR